GPCDRHVDRQCRRCSHRVDHGSVGGRDARAIGCGIRDDQRHRGNRRTRHGRLRGPGPQQGPRAEMRDERMLRVIDTHAHVYPSGHLDAIESLGVDPASTEIARGMHADSNADDMATRLEWMDRAGVDAQVLSVMPQGAFGPDVRAVAEAAASVNDIYARLIEDYPGRFFAYAHLPLPHVAESIAETRRMLAAPGFLGVSVPTVFPDGTALSSPD